MLNRTTISRVSLLIAALSFLIIAGLSCDRGTDYGFDPIRLSDTRHVVFAARDLPAGTQLDHDDIYGKDVPTYWLDCAVLLAGDFEVYRTRTLSMDIEADTIIMINQFSF